MRYFDTGVLLKLYLAEPNSVRAAALITATKSPPLLTPFHQLEMRCAIRQKLGRGEFDSIKCQTLLSQFDSDRARGHFRELTPLRELGIRRLRFQARSMRGDSVATVFIRVRNIRVEESSASRTHSPSHTDMSHTDKKNPELSSPLTQIRTNGSSN